MHETDSNKVVFFSKEDLTVGNNLQKLEPILRSINKSKYNDINEVLELYNIKKYLDNELYLTRWTENDIKSFKQKSVEYGKIIGKFMSKIDDNNFLLLYTSTLSNYIHSFWEIIDNQNIYKHISQFTIRELLVTEPHVINEILIHKNLVDKYDNEIKTFLLQYSKAAEIILSFYEVKDDFKKHQTFLPKSLTVEDKENILSSYLDSKDLNYNYIDLIQYAKNRSDFKVSDKTRLKAKRLHKSETEKIFADNKGIKYGASVSFQKDATKIKDVFIDENYMTHYSYSLDFIKQNSEPYYLFVSIR